MYYECNAAFKSYDHIYEFNMHRHHHKNIITGVFLNWLTDFISILIQLSFNCEFLWYNLVCRHFGYCWCWIVIKFARKYFLRKSVYILKYLHYFSKVWNHYILFSVFCSPILHLFDQKYSKNSTIVKYYDFFYHQCITVVLLNTCFELK